MAFDTGLILRAQGVLALAAAATPRAQSSADAHIHMNGGLLPLLKNAQLVCTVLAAEADADTAVALEVSLDNGTTWREIACVTIPLGFKGQMAVDVGRAFRAYRYAAGNVLVRTVNYNLTNAANTLNVGSWLTTGETDISGKTPADVLMV